MKVDSKKSVSVVVVIPTYNEKANILPLLDDILERADEHKPSVKLDILVVDDSSPDGTGELVASHEDSRVHLLSRPSKQGLGVAYTDAFVYVLENFSSDYVVQMDADQSHAPEDIFRLLRAAKGVDFVLGSRYVAGGKVINWPFSRRLLSWCANLAAGLLLGLWRVRDRSSGFRLIRTELLADIKVRHLRVTGYAIQAALLFAATLKGAQIKEIPIEFVDRIRGASKIGLSDTFGAFWELIRLRFSYPRGGA